jgi:hypothetical protein
MTMMTERLLFDEFVLKVYSMRYADIVSAYGAAHGSTVVCNFKGETA